MPIDYTNNVHGPIELYTFGDAQEHLLLTQTQHQRVFTHGGNRVGSIFIEAGPTKDAAIRELIAELQKQLSPA